MESVYDELKSVCQIEHTRQISFENFLSNLISGLIVYSFLPKKPTLNIEVIDNKQICTTVYIELTLIYSCFSLKTNSGTVMEYIQ